MTELDDLLRRAAASRRLALERALAPHGLTPSQFAALELIVRRPQSCAADLAREEQLTPATMSVILRNLEREGVLRRSARPRGGRAQRLEITPAGSGRLEAAQAAAAPVFAAVALDLDLSLQTALKRGLIRLIGMGA